jgi:HD superfamily phosphohydrolase
MITKRKIINDPVYGFITIDHPLIFKVVAHPFYQRLRRIHQMALAPLVYPGAVHTRLHHSLGAYHLMSNAIAELKNKGFEITADEELGAKIAILLHDLGHGPFSHALEQTLAENIHHEEFSLLLMKKMNEEMNGALQTAIDIFTRKHPKVFLSQLISGQLDVDRMDYLTRDSFFTGVSEGVIGYDRIIKMLTIHNGELMIEEKGIYSIEKFLVARRLMYWQVYLHKTVLSAEQMLKHIIQRAKFIHASSPSEALNYVLALNGNSKPDQEKLLEKFCQLDDHDVMSAIKTWCNHPDKILSLLCQGLLNRRLLKIKYSAEPVSKDLLNEKLKTTAQALNITMEEAGWLNFTGEAISSTYNFENENIHILFKDGSVKDISQVDNALIHQTLATPVKKYYICFYQP